MPSENENTSQLYLALVDIKYKDITGLEIYNLLLDLTKSYEYYCAINKPIEEWDDYDLMIYPHWIGLHDLLQRR